MFLDIILQFVLLREVQNVNYTTLVYHDNGFKQAVFM